jgi:hypothetical protein
MVSVYTEPSTGPVVSDTICERLPQVRFLAQLASAACQRAASCRPVIRNRTAKAARRAPAMAAVTRAAEDRGLAAGRARQPGEQAEQRGLTGDVDILTGPLAGLACAAGQWLLQLAV